MHEQAMRQPKLNFWLGCCVGGCAAYLGIVLPCEACDQCDAKFETGCRGRVSRWMSRTMRWTEE
ncbi:hypothetical protein DL95DRAFT_389008 [Leptodontidium sp. 2 PMI_412]|nr:hypothetical protein DL95DRAFT_389008 [Leptodontidium sp. 2 PMI_412]